MRLRSAGVIGSLDQLPDQNRVAVAVRHPRIGWKAVATRAPGLLVVGFEVLGYIEVRDEAHVGLVDTHPERDGCHNHDSGFVREPLLVRLAYGFVQTRVVRERRYPLTDEPFGRLLDFFAAHAIDDAALTTVPGSE